MPNLNIIKHCYTMATNINNEAEITMYGDIVEKRPTDWWTGEPIEGDYIVQNEFLTDLNNIVKNGAKKLILHMNSLGGDAGVSILIHNKLRELSKKGTELICVVDGVAMSGGSIIMCACDNVKVNPSSLIMIHKCWCFCVGSYNADELREMANSQDAWDKAQIAVYERKSGLNNAVISHMMSATTYMTGREAVEKGFANELIEDAKPVVISANANRTSLVINGKELHLAQGMKVPDIFPVISNSNENDINNQSSAYADENKGGKINMAKNFEELRKENPELAAQVEKDIKAAIPDCNSAEISKEAAKEERARIQSIDEIASLYDEETVNEAKYGKNACTAQEMAFRAAQKAAKTGSAFMANMLEDADESGVKDVSSVQDENQSGGEEKTPSQKMNDARAAVKVLLGKEKK